MRGRTVAISIFVVVLGVAPAACAGAGSSAERPAGVLPANAGSGQASAPRRGVRDVSSPTCSSIGATGFVGGGSSNVAELATSAVLDGTDNEDCEKESSIGGGHDNYISSGTLTANDSFIGAGQINTIAGSGRDSVIGGGESNTLSALDSVITGGSTNTLSGSGYGFIGGGYENVVSAEYAVVAGGLDNQVSGAGGYIATGGYNNVSGTGAVIDGGFNSTASGNFAMIPGGYGNSAAGTYSFAAGARASAAQNGTFVWSDGSDGDGVLTSTAAYQFLARASGGFTLYTNAASTVGAQLAAGSGTWSSLSDRNAKTNVTPLDDATVLAKVAALPISRWSYKSEHGVRHVGPMAQDFYAAFKVGEDDKHITSIDEDGVALAAIKALRSENAALRARLASAERRHGEHDRRVDAELSRLRTAIAALAKR